MAETIGVPRDVLQVVFDTAVHNMNFASGMLDDEEVSALRAVADLLGVDPMEATPPMFKCKYRGHHGETYRSGLTWFVNGPPEGTLCCVDCRQAVPDG